MTEVLKGKTFEWNEQAHSAFEEIKGRLTNAFILALPGFSKVFKVDCYASRLGVRAICPKRSSL